MRLVSLLSGAVCILLTYLLGRCLWDRWSGLLGAVLLAVSATMLAWSTTAHPDMLQLLWLLLGLLLAARMAEQPSRLTLSVAAVCAGLAFATKYTGELLLPVLWLGDLLGRAATGPGDRATRLRAQAIPFIVDILLSAAIFLACFLIVDPSVLREPRSFVYQMTFEAGLAHGGHLLLAHPDPVAWLRLLAGADLLGPLGLAAGLAGLLAWTAADLRSTVIGAARGPSLTTAARRLPFELWTAGYLVLLLVWIGDQQARYALPALPGLALVTAASLVWLCRRSVPAAVASAVALALVLVPVGISGLSYEQAQAHRMQNPALAERIAAGRWLTAHATSDTRIVYDAYAYIPTSFTSTEETFGLTHTEIQSFRPAIIVTDTDIRDRFRDPALAIRYTGGPATYQEIAATYRELEAGSFPCLPLAARFGAIDIFGIPSRSGATPGC